MKHHTLVHSLALAAFAGAAILGTSAVASADPTVDDHVRVGSGEPTVAVAVPARPPNGVLPVGPPDMAGSANPQEYDPADFEPGELELTCGSAGIVWVFEENSIGHPIPGTFDVDCA